MYIITPKPGKVAKSATSSPFRLGIEPASTGLLDQCSTTELQKPLPTIWEMSGSHPPELFRYMKKHCWRNKNEIE